MGILIKSGDYKNMIDEGVYILVIVSKSIRTKRVPHGRKKERS